MRELHWAVLSLGLLLCACASKPLEGELKSDMPRPSMEILGQTQLPAGAKIDHEKSLIMGSGDQWVGRVSLDVGRDVSAAYKFFLETYPQQGWTLVSAVRGQTSLLVFTKQERNATVEFQEGSLFGSGSVTMTVSPRNATVSAPRRP
ncbi:MAG: hypothetical protein FGM21_10270 [Limnohabitans sp.]|jgi:hypothetical protein|nr:hypothetical protein [Limnohabitans sp.]